MFNFLSDNHLKIIELLVNDPCLLFLVSSGSMSRSLLVFLGMISVCKEVHTLICLFVEVSCCETKIKLMA